VKEGLQTEGRANGLARPMQATTTANKGLQCGMMTCSRKEATVSFDSPKGYLRVGCPTAWVGCWGLHGLVEEIHPLLLGARLFENSSEKRSIDWHGFKMKVAF
jgi:hypothetical protein